MSRAARSVFAFGSYALVLGAGLLWQPGWMLRPIGFRPSAEEWLRVLGAIVAVLGFYYVLCARAELVAFFRATVVGRLALASSLVVLVALGLGEAPLLILAAVDAAGAVWTWRALGEIAA